MVMVMAKKKQYDQPRNYDNSKGRQYTGIPRAVTESANYRKLTCDGKALLLDAASMFGGQDNGAISLSWDKLKPLGWRTKRRITDAIYELLHYGFIQLTRQGGSHVANLYALTWVNIHSCGGKLHVQPTTAPACSYHEERPMYVSRYKRKKQTIQSGTVKLMSTGEIPEHEIKKSGSPLVPKRFTPDANGGG